jgi:2-haloacid dehalogenase
MPALFALDIYGTVIDPGGIGVELGKLFGEQARAAALLWREKQLEFTFRRALMRSYADFDVCTAQALTYVGSQLGVDIDDAHRRALLAAYLRLPAFPDAEPGLKKLRGAGHRIVALTNGTEKSVGALLRHAGISEHFEMILSADSIRTFKPDPAVYELVQRTGVTPPDRAWLVSGNPFDVIGAKAYGLKSAWVRRDPARIFEPWEFSPDIVVGNLEELGQAV